MIGFIASTSSAAPGSSIDLARLRDVICDRIETGNRAAPDGTPPYWLIGDNGRSLGKCQVQYETAVRIGGLDPRREGFPALGDLQRNRHVALTILAWCYYQRGRRTVIGLAACYNGTKMDYPKRDDPRPAYRKLRIYAEAVAKAYKDSD